MNGAAIAELKHGVGRGRDLRSLVYITIGTGVGVGICIDQKPLIGVSHAEAGHVRVGRHPDDTFAGICPFHGDCVEGMSSATAIAARLRRTPDQLQNVADDDPVWDLIGFYLGRLCANLILTVSPEQIVLGGGVARRASLIPIVRREVDEALSGYVAGLVSADMVQQSHLDPSAGVVGSHQLAIDLLR